MCILGFCIDKSYIYINVVCISSSVFGFAPADGEKVVSVKFLIRFQHNFQLISQYRTITSSRSLPSHVLPCSPLLRTTCRHIDSRHEVLGCFWQKSKYTGTARKHLKHRVCISFSKANNWEKHARTHRALASEHREFWERKHHHHTTRTTLNMKIAFCKSHFHTKNKYTMSFFLLVCCRRCCF